MAQNLMNSAHKAKNENFRKNYDEIFRKKKVKDETPEHKKDDGK